MGVDYVGQLGKGEAFVSSDNWTLHRCIVMKFFFRKTLVFVSISIVCLLAALFLSYLHVLLSPFYYSIFVDIDSPPQEIARKIEGQHKLYHPLTNPLNLNSSYLFYPKDYAKYQLWINATRNYSKESAGPALIIDKAGSRLFLVDDGKVLHSLPVSFGPNPFTDKYMQGDGATPEGMYEVSEVTGLRGKVSFMINYPSDEDWSEFKVLKAKGLIPGNASIGDRITISADRYSNDGAVLLAGEDIAVLVEAGVSAGTPVTLVRYGMLSYYSNYQ